MLWISRIILDVATQPHYKIIDSAGVGIFVQSPYFFENLFTGDDVAVVVYQVTQQLRFHQRQMDGMAPGAQLQRSEVDGLSFEGKLAESFGSAGLGASLARRGHRDPLHPLAAPQHSLQARQ